MRMLKWPIKTADEPDYLGCIHCAALTAKVTASEGNALTRMFRWWNEAYRLDAFTEEAFAEHFSEDVVMIVNGEVRARDLEELTAHFQRVKAGTQSVEIELPLDESFTSQDKIFGHYRARARVSGVHTLEDTMASVGTANGRISFFNAISRQLS